MHLCSLFPRKNTRVVEAFHRTRRGFAVRLAPPDGGPAPLPAVGRATDRDSFAPDRAAGHDATRDAPLALLAAALAGYWMRGVSARNTSRARDTYAAVEDGSRSTRFDRAHGRACEVEGWCRTRAAVFRSRIRTGRGAGMRTGSTAGRVGRAAAAPVLSCAVAQYRLSPVCCSESFT